MEILHRDCTVCVGGGGGGACVHVGEGVRTCVQRDRPRLFVRGNDDLHIDRYFIVLPAHLAAVSL